MNRYTASIAFAIFIPLLLISSQQVFAAPHTLTDENAVVVIEDGAGGSNAGVMSYTVDGVDHMTQEAWFFSVGSGAEAPIASLGVDTVTVTDEDSDGDADKLVITYLQPANFGFTQTFELTGGAAGSGIATLKETVSTGSASSIGFLNVFLYTNFDAEGNSINTSVRSATLTVVQGISGPPFATTTTFSAQPNAALELGLASDLLGRLTNGVADVFVNTAVSSGFGPGDGAFVAHYQTELL